MTKSKKENFLLRLADGERDAEVVFLSLNVVALQGAPEVVGTVALFTVISACSARARASASCALEAEAPPLKNPPDERAAASEEEEKIPADGSSGRRLEALAQAASAAAMVSTIIFCKVLIWDTEKLSLCATLATGAGALDPHSKLTGSTICGDPPTSLSLLGASSPCPSCT
eukprot:2411799-Rhodomonas_salina.1